jgi:predicted nucleic acid-binding protein
MQSSYVADFKNGTVLAAADLSLKHDLPMADAIVYATALIEGATLVTSDEHFRGLAEVKFIV